MRVTSAARKIPGLIICFHRDKTALRKADGRSPAKQLAFDPGLGEGTIRGLRSIYQDKVWGLQSAPNPWLVVHTYLDPQVEYNFAWAQMRAVELMRSLLAEAAQLLIEGTLKVDDGVKIKGRAAQLGQDGETVFHGFDDVSGTFLETVVEQAALAQTEVYASRIVREVPDLSGPLSQCENLRIKHSSLLGLCKIFGRSSEPDSRGLISQSFIEGAAAAGAEAKEMRPEIWNKVVVPGGSEAPEAEVRFMNKASFRAAIREHLSSAGEGKTTRLALMLYRNQKLFSRLEFQATLSMLERMGGAPAAVVIERWRQIALALR